MKKLIIGLFCGSLVLSTTACGQAPLLAQGAPGQLRAASAGLQSNATLPRTPKAETPIRQRKVKVTRTRFDAIAEKNLKKQYQKDAAFTKAPSRNARSPFDGPSGNMPFRTYSDFEDHIRYGYDTPHEDNKYMNRRYARNHFNRYINGAFRDVQELYNASRSDMKRFISLDVLVNSLTVSSRTLPYQDIHNPPAERNYKFLPTEAARVMPTFGEIVSFNRNSYDVNYERWDTYRAARYYQANYRRIFGLVMEHGPTKTEAFKMVHREITSYAGR